MIEKKGNIAMLKSPLAINANPIPDFTRPLELLVHCHSRIEYQLSALERGVELLRKSNIDQYSLIFGSIDAALSHFAGPGVKHIEDEEVSLFPRIRRYGKSGEEILAAVAELELDHQTIEQLERELELSIKNIPRHLPAEAIQLDNLAEMVAKLASLYRNHINIENGTLYPALKQILSSKDIEQLGEEMQARRRPIQR
jgi:hemerythrin-like domain-containing protein